MAVVDLITGVDAICKKYEKYAFARLYGVFETQVDSVLQKAEAATVEKSRATAVAMNAEVRRSKARLLEEIPKLQRLALKKVKGLSREELEARDDLVAA